MPGIQSSPTPASMAPLPAVSGEHWIEALKDGSHVLIRPLRAEDRERERSFIMQLSPSSRHARFLGEMRELSETALDQLMKTDDRQNVAFVALAHCQGVLTEVGISRYAATTKPLHCECAVTVADAWQRRGLGSLLLKHLIEAARRQGFTEIDSIDSGANSAMRALAHRFGFTTRSDPEDASQVIHSLRLTA